MADHILLRDEVFIVDDEPLICEALSVIFTFEGYQVTSFSEADSFLAAARERVPAFVLLDVGIPGRSGLDILEELNAGHPRLPVFIMSGRNDSATVVDAMRRGALDFIEKPFNTETVTARVRAALAGHTRASAGRLALRVQQFPGHHLLTPRERDVLALIAGGASNKEAGRQLGISPRTVEVHRARIMDKLAARNAADLVRIVLTESGEL